MRVGMALPKAVGYMVGLLLLYYSLQNQVYRVSLNVFFEGLMGTKASHTHAREKREASLSSSSYVLQAVINTSDLERVRTLLGEFILPYRINGTALITSINTTTVCSSNLSGYQCRCEESYAWSYNSCINYEACDAIIGDTCGCVNALPADGQYCQLNTSRTETTPPPATPTPTNDPVIIDLILDVRIPVSSVPSNFINIFRNTLNNVPLPFTVTQSLQVTGLNFTTGCFPNSTGGLQCECEEQFAWSCDKCVIYGACSNATRQTCGCINGLPSDGEYCRPITNVTQCPTPTPGMTTPMTTTTPMTITTTTTPPPTTTTTTTTTTTPTTTTPTTPTTMTTTTPTTTTTTPIPTPTTTMTTITPTTTTTTPTPTPTTTTMTTTTTTPTPTPTTTTMTTTTPTMTTTTPTPTTVITQVRSLSFTMDLTFDSSYNNPNNIIYQDSFNSIERQSNTHISTFTAVASIRFRSGSTICDYAVNATSFQEMEIKALEAGIFTELSEKYPILFDSPTPLEFVPPQVLSGNTLTITCGPPENLNFGTNFIAEWRRDNDLIRQDDQHVFSNGGTTLTVLNFFSTDNGGYECKLRRGDNSAFRQRSNGVFKLEERPLIQVSPVRQIVQCENGKEVPLTCSVNSPYEVEFKGTSTAGTGEIIHQFPIDCAKTEEIITCQVKNFSDFSRDITLALSTENSFRCNDPVFGVGNEGDEALARCEVNEVGERTVACEGDGEWREKRDDCVLEAVQKLLDQAKFLNNNSLPNFLSQLSNVTLNSTEDVVDSPATINAIVEILSTVANLSIPITRTSMEDILLTTGVLTTDEAQESWNFLNTNDTRNISTTTARSVSSTFLLSLENITSSLTNDSFDIDTPFILLNKTTFTDTFNAEFNSSVETNILESDGEIKSITVITFASMDNVLPARDQDNSSFNVINGRVVLVQSNVTINNVSFTFDIINDTLRNPQCVFWNFRLFDGLGGWDGEGCELVRDTNQTVTCNCNHLTSFSILMSPSVPNDPALDFITYIGVGISMGSLVICLIIETVIWRKIRKNNTSYLRHVSIVNIAVSLLIANIWFIIGAAISDADEKNVAACNAATFFGHFFYLALFFWMLASALLLFYRTVSVFDGGLSKKSLLAIGFCLGYGAPLLIVTITIAVTAPKEEYIRQIGCWLNWDESRALLAFVIPVLLIVVINFLILLVVMYKMLRRRVVGDAAQAAERHVLVVIVRSLAVLTPFFGLTWGLGVGTVTDPRNRGIHVSFAFFNSLQGFFILVFGTLLDKKVRSEITIKSLTGTTTSSTGISSSGGLAFLRNWRRDGYNVSSSATGLSQSFTDT